MKLNGVLYLIKQHFFTKYKAYLKLTLWANSANNFRKWFGWIESKLRILISNLEQTEGIKGARPYPNSFPEPTVYMFSCTFYIGLLGVGRNVDLAPPVYSFKDMIYEWVEKIEGMDLVIIAVKSKDIPQEVVQSEKVVKKIKLDDINSDNPLKKRKTGRYVILF